MSPTLPDLITQAQDYPIQDAAGPLADVARALGEAPGSLPREVVTAALTLAAEQLTAQAEACRVCASWLGLCDYCSAASSRAAAYQMQASQQLAGVS